jgi:hypothetical protein
MHHEEAKMKKIPILLLLALSAAILHAQIPDLPPHSIYFVKSEGGWDLYIRKINGIGSIILTESQRDPDYRVTAYSLRSIVKSPINAIEKRILNGKPIKSQDKTIYLIDSTPEKVGTIGDFYRFFLTDEVVFGYPWARMGTMKIEAGVKINARLFEKKFGDYEGRFKDQWITLTPEALPLEKAEVKEKPPTEKAKVETTIVLLHSSDVDTELPPAPSPAPAPKATEKPGARTTFAGAADKISHDSIASSAITSSYSMLVVEKQTRFPFEKIKDTQPGADEELQANEERVLCRYLFEMDKDQNTRTAGFATYHLDGQGRLVRVNEYGKDNLLVAVYLIEYGTGAEPLSVTAYDKAGRVAAQ